MKVTFEIPDEIKYCNLCGRPFNAEDYGKTMAEQTEGMRTDCERWFYCSKYCGLFCAWLADPDSSVHKGDKYEKMFPSRKYNNIAKMRDYIAKRVAQYLLKESKKS